MSAKKSRGLEVYGIFELVEKKEPKDELNVLIEEAIKKYPGVKGHTEICPETGTPYKTIQKYIPEGPLAHSFVTGVCSGCDREVYRGKPHFVS